MPVEKSINNTGYERVFDNGITEKICYVHFDGYLNTDQLVTVGDTIEIPNITYDTQSLWSQTTDSFNLEYGSLYLIILRLIGAPSTTSDFELVIKIDGTAVKAVRIKTEANASSVSESLFIVKSGDSLSFSLNGAPGEFIEFYGENDSRITITKIS